MIRLGLYGYGNLARGVESAVAQNPDMELCAVFTRREPDKVKTVSGVPVFSSSEVLSWTGRIDVLILCGGSASDLPEMTPRLARSFAVVDSFDTHAKIPEHFARVDEAARSGGHAALISGGWDPGLFSLARVYAACVLPESRSYTFWGRGVSQGHSEAIRRIPGVVDARQYTVPVEASVRRVCSGECPELTTREKHRRECYVVAEEGADRERITRSIVSMPDYFADYDTSVTFLSREELLREHGGLPHGGLVRTNGTTGGGNRRQSMEFRLSLDSNPEFTGSVLCALARAVDRKNRRGDFGAKTVFDVAPAELSPLSPEELRERYL